MSNQQNDRLNEVLNMLQDAADQADARADQLSQAVEDAANAVEREHARNMEVRGNARANEARRLFNEARRVAAG